MGPETIRQYARTVEPTKSAFGLRIVGIFDSLAAERERKCNGRFLRGGGGSAGRTHSRITLRARETRKLPVSYDEWLRFRCDKMPRMPEVSE